MIEGINTIQDLFNHVAKHLLKQDAQSCKVVSGSDNACVYFGRNGMRCAIGCLIEPEQYYENLEFEGIHSIPIRQAIQYSIGRKITDEETSLLRLLRICHDKNSPDIWYSVLSDIAINNNLEMIA
jgi:hypothetical protein